MFLWKNVNKLEHSKCFLSHIGPLKVYYMLKTGEVNLAFDRDPDKQHREIETVQLEDTSMPLVDWERWVIDENCDKISFSPVMPDRPVVVRPEMPVNIPAKHSARFYVSIPAWVAIFAHEKKETIELCRAASSLLSNIWFGDLKSGELCYSLLTRARRDVTEIDYSPNRVLCPVLIWNRTGVDLNVERFCIHVEQLNIYQDGKQLWSNGVTINYQGEDSANKIVYLKRPPEHAKDSKLLTEAVGSKDRAILKWSIGTFKQMTGF